MLKVKLQYKQCKPSKIF